MRLTVKNERQIRRELRAVHGKAANEPFKKANAEVSKLITDASKRGPLPVKSGLLSSLTKPSPTTKKARVRSGSKAKAPYAGVIHFGDPHRGIKAQPYITDVVKEHWKDAKKMYVASVDRLTKRLQKGQL